MAQKWNLQDIRPAESQRRRQPKNARPVDMNQPGTRQGDESDSVEHVPVTDGRKRKNYLLITAVVVFVLIVGAGFAFSAFLAGAEITVYPKNRQPNVNAEFTAVPTPRADQLSYEILTLEETGERQVSASGEQETTEPATGTIEIFKTTPGAQPLVETTRFESPDGLIYRIQEEVVVPGAVQAADGTLVPGSVQAPVVSDDTSEEANQPADTRFTIPGLESDPSLFEAMYGENPEPLTGGFDGMRYSIDEEELETTTQELQTELRDTLLEQIADNVPAGFTAFPNAVTITYNSLPPVEYGDDLVTIKEEATLQIPIFKRDTFAAFIAQATIPGYEGLAVRIEDPSVFTFDYTTPTTSSATLANLDSIDFSLRGKPLIVWEYDEGKLKTDLLGKAKTALSQVLSGYPAIERAEAVVRPFWKRSFPEELEAIEIIERITNEAADE